LVRYSKTAEFKIRIATSELITPRGNSSVGRAQPCQG
jgi:hypothetical protein